MAYDNGYTAVTGATFSAAQYNTYDRDNRTAMWVYDAAGQIAVSSSATALTKLEAASNENKIIMSNGTTFELVDDVKWLPIAMNTDTPLTSGDDKFRFPIPPVLDGYVLTYVIAFRKSGTGTLTIQLNNETTGQDMLTTRVTVDSGEQSSLTAAAPVVINTAQDDVSSYDIIGVDVSDAGTSTLYGFLLLGFEKF